jgi:hypothetical protein
LGLWLLSAARYKNGGHSEGEKWKFPFDIHSNYEVTDRKLIASQVLFGVQNVLKLTYVHASLLKLFCSCTFGSPLKGEKREKREGREGKRRQTGISCLLLQTLEWFSHG